MQSPSITVRQALYERHRSEHHGALPAQHGLRTAGVVDLTTRSEFTPDGSLSMYGGSFGTVSPSFDYGGGVGNTQYFVTGRYTQDNQGLEKAAPTVNPI